MTRPLPRLLLCLSLCSALQPALAADAAEQLGTAAIQALVQEADALLQQNQYESALALLERAQAAAGPQLAAPVARNVLNSLANLYYSTGQLEAAARHYRQLVEFDGAAGDMQGLSVSRFNLAHTLGSQGDLPGAQEQLEQALELSRALGDASGEAFTLKALGVNAQALGQLELARSHLLAARAGFARLGDSVQEAAVQRHLGDVLLAEGAADAAVQHYQSAIPALRDSAFNSALLNTYRGLSQAWEQLGDYPSALASQRAYTELLQYDLEQRNVDNTQRLQAELQTRHLAAENERLELLRVQQDLQLSANRRNLQLQSLALGLGATLIALVLWMLRRSGVTARRMQQLATTDELTRLLNRRAIMARGNEEWQRCLRFRQPLSCLMFDADHFKSINDDFGHGVGDEVLRQIAAQLRGVLRKTDAVGRIGGEEFLLLAPQTDRLQAMSLAERIRAAIEACEIPGLDGRRLTVSIGVAGLQGEESLDELVRHADQALYIAKSSGRNRCILFHEKKPPLPRPSATEPEPLAQV